MVISTLSTHQKALSINLDPSRYGTFAEIGAGQEVVRQFFQVGGAAGTVAKSMSAYDMTVSDAIYGREALGRYVCDARLREMLKHEYQLLVERLWRSRSEATTFFSFANTCATWSFSHKKNCHAWLGIKFQIAQKKEPNEIIVHVHLLDHDTLMQQGIIGTLGINIIYAAFNYSHHREKLIHSLTDNIPVGRISIDIALLEGPDYDEIDNRLNSLQLLEMGLTQSVVFDSTGDVVQAADVFRKKHILIQRGSFRPLTHVNMDMEQCARKQFVNEPRVKDGDYSIFMEITLHNLHSDEFSHQDFLDRVQLLSAMGYPVIISNFSEFSQLARYIRGYTDKLVALVLGIHDLENILKDEYYQNKDYDRLTLFAEMFENQSHAYLYPKYDDTNQVLRTTSNLELEDRIKPLIQYLVDNRYLQDLNECDTSKLHIYSKKVLQLLRSGDDCWENMVPSKVADIIKEKKLWHSKDQ